MIFHIFNPEHDLALASGSSRFTAPHAARQLHADLDFIPAFWAQATEAVLVSDAAMAREKTRRLVSRLGQMGIRVSPHTSFIEPKDLRTVVADGVIPWGWDAALCHDLCQIGVREACLPPSDVLKGIRDCSHRRTSALALQELHLEEMVGKSVEVRSSEQITEYISHWGPLVLKAPWSCSGRGVRFVDERGISDNVRHWADNVIRDQGSLMVEPYYNKVKDFGMEFLIDADGTLRYLGLSLFSTLGSAYTGNVLATEFSKSQLLSPYVSVEKQLQIRLELERVLPPLLSGRYSGPLGVDMMVVGKVSEKGFYVHPCVELNLRHTMGHLALTLSPRDDDDVQAVMNICFDKNRYHIKITNQTKENYET